MSLLIDRTGRIDLARVYDLEAARDYLLPSIAPSSRVPPVVSRLLGSISWNPDIHRTSARALLIQIRRRLGERASG